MRYPWFLTKAVVARVVPLSVMRGVGAVGVPVRDGDARRAYDAALIHPSWFELAARVAVEALPVRLPINVGAVIVPDAEILLEMKRFAQRLELDPISFDDDVASG